ncbi:unnamed protein product [Taenia asiatica]|uniref:Doublecortin domain-containing protein n=1 Tax=Taenia asiatica TaxID=60517 RepID=A0A0R3VX59_TAEAS|nr:unnamed protein product [Taenia asiatica]
MFMTVWGSAYAGVASGQRQQLAKHFVRPSIGFFRLQDGPEALHYWHRRSNPILKGINPDFCYRILIYNRTEEQHTLLMGKSTMTPVQRIDSDVNLRHYASPLFCRKGNNNGSDASHKPSENARYEALYGTRVKMSNKRTRNTSPTPPLPR